LKWTSTIRKLGTAILLLLIALSGFPRAFGKAKLSQDPQRAREDYIARIQQQTTPSLTNTSPGSLWQPDGLMNDLAADYKARRLNDVVTIIVVQQTSAQAAGDVSTERDFNTQSGISGLAGHISTSGISNLLTAQSSSKLKGQGSLDASSAMKTSLAGQIIAVLSSGAMVVEAHRLIVINNQKETMIVRGVLLLPPRCLTWKSSSRAREWFLMLPARPTLLFGHCYG